MLNYILSSLDKVKKCRNGYIACCPAHDDNNPSLSITEKDGRILMYCHAGCDIEDICSALDIKVYNLFEEDE